MRVLFPCALLLVCGTKQVEGTVIGLGEHYVGLYNTGVDDLGNALPVGSVDPHYTVEGVPWRPGDPNPAIVANGSPLWLDGNAGSDWISVDDHGGYPWEEESSWVYRTLFNLPELDGFIGLTGFWASDNLAVHMKLNGHDTGNSLLEEWSFVGLHEFSITSPGWFNDGVNVLEFEVFNLAGGGENPTGLRTDSLQLVFGGSGGPSDGGGGLPNPVPDTGPSVVLLLLTCLPILLFSSVPRSRRWLP